MSDKNFEMALLLKFNKYMWIKYSNSIYNSLCKQYICDKQNM